MLFSELEKNDAKIKTRTQYCLIKMLNNKNIAYRITILDFKTYYRLIIKNLVLAQEYTCGSVKLIRNPGN